MGIGSRMSETNNGRGNPIAKYGRAHLVFLVGVFGVFVPICVNLAFFWFMRKTVFYSAPNCSTVSDVFYCYLNQGGAWSDATYLQTITGFYTSVITILIAALAVVAAFGAYTLKASARAQIEQEIPPHISDYFDRDKGKELLAKQAATVVSDQSLRLPFPSEGGLYDAFISLENKVASLELQIQEMQEE
ncbi:hypothetical protein [Paracoccus versutus]|uniref:hypothetical protein n=1 Tax=Paracoccus versutus TaxID=34007 RepID=UPI0011C04103|nr:hypothetical protein [Paracoccus versutus]WGR57416.1 hypothetical protein E3U25_15600 [Paracoccus versutus]